MTAVAFLVVDLATGRRLGGAVVATDARYCSRIHAGAHHQVDRRFVPASDWPKIERELQQLDNGPVDASSAVSTAVLGPFGSHSLALQKLHETPVEGEPVEIATKLDTVLRSLVPPTLSLRREH